jgi:hypothetical protein
MFSVRSAKIFFSRVRQANNSPICLTLNLKLFQTPHHAGQQTAIFHPDEIDCLADTRLPVELCRLLAFLIQLQDKYLLRSCERCCCRAILPLLPDGET